MDVKIENSWKMVLSEEFEKKYFTNLKSFLVKEKEDFQIFPTGNQIFTAFNLTPIDQVKVVILGQDPYHGMGQAHGLSFSVPDGIPFPPSRRNIINELIDDVQIQKPEHGNLSHWAKQGVFLLNATLTVRMGLAGSHQSKGWEFFTDAVIKKISDQKQNVVFILWGNYAIKKSNLIDQSKHLIISSVHPSPLSAHRGFFGSKPFSKTNEYLTTHHFAPIDWNII
jgi:uracil-DNA glycosylase